MHARVHIHTAVNVINFYQLRNNRTFMILEQRDFGDVFVLDEFSFDRRQADIDSDGGKSVLTATKALSAVHKPHLSPFVFADLVSNKFHANDQANSN